MKKAFTVIGTAVVTILLVRYTDTNKLGKDFSDGWSIARRLFKKDGDRDE